MSWFTLRWLDPVFLYVHPLSSGEALAGHHSKNSNNRKIGSWRGRIGRGKRREPLPYNISKMAPNFRGRLDRGGFSQIFSTWRNIQSDKKRKLSLFLNKLYREQSKAEKPFVGNVFRKSVLLISSPRELE